jgi:hypothetical protein
MMNPSDPPPASVLPQPQYEFTEPQNQAVTDLADSMQWVSRGLMWLGLAMLIVAVAHAIQEPRTLPVLLPIFITLMIYMALGHWTQKASESFLRIPATQGHDIDHLMAALGNLRKAFWLQATLIKLSVILLTIWLVGWLLVIALWSRQS